MEQKQLITIIGVVQNVLLGISLVMLATLPILIAYQGDRLSSDFQQKLFFVSLFSAMLVMSIRPLANLFPHVRILSSLVILRKGLGVFSASIIVSLILSRIMIFGWDYVLQFFTASYWSFENFAFLARIGDVTAILLLITSNNYSKRILGRNWKRIQRSAYAYFYAGAFYEFLYIQDAFAPYAILIVTTLVITAYLKNHHNKKKAIPLSA